MLVLLRRIGAALLTEGMCKDSVETIGRIFLAFSIVVILGLIAFSSGGVDYKHRALGTDFITFWTASKLVLQDKAAEVYNVQGMIDLCLQQLPGLEGNHFWLYPPTFLLLVTPLALLPYLLALLLFTLLGLGLGGLILRRWPDSKLHLLLFLAAPATLLNVLQGQNGFFTTALWMLGLGLMTKRPFWSGMVLGLLVYKPHFAVIAPLVFLLRRDRQGLAGLTVSAGSFLLISTLIFGNGIWPLFISTSTTASHMLSTGIILPWEKMGSLFVSMRLLEVPVTGAVAVHIVGAGVTLFLLARLWLTKAPTDVKYAATLISTLLVTPHQFDYDLVLLLGAIAFWVRGAGSTLSDREKILLVLLWFAPLFTPPLAKITHLGLLPVILLAALIALSHRAEKQSVLPDNR